MLKIAIRDDDINYFTKVEEIEKAYKNIINKYPIGFAAIPFIHKSQLLMKSIIETNRSKKMEKLYKKEMQMNKDGLEKYYKNYYFFHKNKELLNYINQKILENNIEIYLHGITHRYYRKGAEFSKTNFIIEEEIEMAKKYFEEIFNKEIKYFVPPSNAISFKNLKRINGLGMKLIISGWPISENIIERTILMIKKLKKIEFSFRLKKYIDEIKINKNKMVICGTFSPNDTVETFLNRYNLKDKKDGNIIIATHYTNHLDINCYTNFIKLIEYFKNKGAKFYKISELYD